MLLHSVSDEFAFTVQAFDNGTLLAERNWCFDDFLGGVTNEAQLLFDQEPPLDDEHLFHHRKDGNVAFRAELRWRRTGFDEDVDGDPLDLNALTLQFLSN